MKFGLRDRPPGAWRSNARMRAGPLKRLFCQIRYPCTQRPAVGGPVDGPAERPLLAENFPSHNYKTARRPFLYIKRLKVQLNVVHKRKTAEG